MKFSAVKLFSLLLVFFLVLQSCKKEWGEKITDLNPLLIQNFFKNSPGTHPEVLKVANNWSKQKGFKEQLGAFVKKNGTPVWNRALVQMKNNSSSQIKGKVESDTASSAGIFFIPLEDTLSSEIKSYVVCSKHDDSTYSYRLYNKQDVSGIAANTNDTLKRARNITLSMFAYFEKEINYNDSTFFGGQTNKTIGNVSIVLAGSGNANLGGRVDNTSCGYWNTMTIVAEVYSDNTYGTVIETYNLYYYIFCATEIRSGGGGTSGWDPGNVGLPGDLSGGMAGSNGVYYYTGSSGTSNYGWWTYGSGYNGIYINGSWYDPSLYPSWNGPSETLYYTDEQMMLNNLKLTLGLNGSQFDILNTNLNMVSALKAYLDNGIQPWDEKVAAIKEHIDEMVTNPVYLNFVQNYTENYNSVKVWWDNEIWLNTYFPGVYSNIQALNLYPKQAYYLLNNLLLNEKINNYRLNNNGESLSDKETAVKSHINGILTNPEYAAFVNNYDATNNSGKMWWDRVGYDFAVPPFFWSYQGNNGQALLDNYPNLSPTFQFPLNNNYSTLYPRFTEMVMNLKTFVKENPKVMDALEKYSGLTKTQILDHLSFGQGPIINIVEMEGRIGQFKKENGNKTLEIRASYIRGLEQAVLQSTKEGTAFLLAVTILHEYVHYGNFTGKRSEGAYDFGFGFERDAFNVIVEYFNANSVVIKFSKYF